MSTGSASHLVELQQREGQPDAHSVLLRPPAETPGGSLLTPEEPTLRRVLEQLRLIAETDEVKGLFLRLGPLGGT